VLRESQFLLANVISRRVKSHSLASHSPERNLIFANRKLNFSDASPDGQRGSEDISIGSGVSGIPGSPAMSSCSEGEPPHSPIENYLSPSSRSRSPILSSSMPAHVTTTQSDVDSLRQLLQEVLRALIHIRLYSFHSVSILIRVCFRKLV